MNTCMRRWIESSVTDSPPRRLPSLYLSLRSRRSARSCRTTSAAHRRRLPNQCLRSMTMGDLEVPSEECFFSRVSGGSKVDFTFQRVKAARTESLPPELNGLSAVWGGSAFQAPSHTLPGVRDDPQRLRFEIGARDGTARAGVIHTAHGPIETPAFIPLATKGTVRGLESAEVAELGYQLILGNTYHLFVSPGPERIAAAGGLHGFMNWERAIITDSGGFQVFSLAHGGVANEVKGTGRSGGHGSQVEISEEGARFRSPRDGAELFISPEVSMSVQAPARLRHRPRLRRVHALPRRPRVHRPLDRAHPPLARPLPRLAR